jgi:PII-like signaling protein
VTGLKLTVYVGEHERAGGGLATRRLGELFAREGVRLAVLLRGIEGFGLKHALQTHRLLTLSEDLPLVWVAIDEPDRIHDVARKVDELLPHGLVTLERAQVGERSADLALEGDEAAKLTIYCGRGERSKGSLAHHGVVDRLREVGVEGASVLLGVDGVRAGLRLRPRLIGTNRDIPVMILAVGSHARLADALPELDGLLDGPVLTLERVRILKQDGASLAPLRELPATDAGGLGLWHKIMVYTGEDAAAPGGHGPLYAELLRELKRAGAGGGTALGGVWGYSGTGAAHGDRFMSLRRRVPVVCVCVDRPRRIAELWPVIDAMTARSGLVTGEFVPAFRAAGPAARVGGLRLADIP